MALDQEAINAQLAQLASHRQRLVLLLQQQAKLGAYTPPYVLIDIQEAQSAIRRIKEQLHLDGVLVEDEPNDDMQPATVAVPSRLSPQEQRNRRAMLQKVKAIWIDGLLEQSLAKELRITLDLTEQPDTVDILLNTLVQELNRPPQPLPPGTPIIEVFDQMGGALLILGAPGAGKTTLLLELARDLIARAEEDEKYPIPVVFNLSSWVEKRQPLKQWLVEELNTKYDVPRKVAQAWKDTDAILPLLDGLDEVAAEQRSNCAEAINTYRREYGLVPLLVCSRVADYRELTTKLRLQGAVVVQPLIRQQVDRYFERTGDRLIGVRIALRDDEVLREMLDTPLMLSITALAYAGKAEAEVQATGTLDERRRHLFDAYISEMFQRRGEQADYRSHQTKFRLSWLAGKLMKRDLTLYYTHQMQPDWLADNQKRSYYRCQRLLAGLIVVLVIGLIGVGLFEPDFGLGVVWGVGVGIGLGLGSGLGVNFGVGVGLGADFEHIKTVQILRWSWSYGGLIGGLIAGSVGGGFVGLYIRQRIELDAGLVAGLLTGSLTGLVAGLVVGLLFGLLFGVGIWPSIGANTGLSSSEIETKTTLGQGSLRLARSWLFFGLLFGLLFGVGTGLFSGSGVGRGFLLGFGLEGGLSFGLGYGLSGNGRAILQRYIFCYFLSRNGILPFRERNLIAFLDYCADRIFLRKVGGGYIFVHRLLMEHFASLYTEQPREERRV